MEKYHTMKDILIRLREYFDYEQKERKDTDSQILINLHNEFIRATDRENQIESNLVAALEAEIDNRTTADTNIINLINQVENQLNTKIEAETTRATNAEDQLANSLSAEINNRQEADDDLQDSITEVANNLNDEIDARQQADSELQQNITDEATVRAEQVNSLQQSINNEISARQTADTNLQTNITNEATARQQADSTLQSNIDAEETARQNADSNLQDNIDAEETTRQAADSDLQDNIDAEELARQQADTTLDGKITAEETRASTAEDTLQDNIDAEVTRASEAEQSLQDNIAAEATARDSADDTLQDNIDAEATRAQGVESTLQDNIDAEETRAKGAEGALDTKIDGVASDLSAEAQARQTADDTLQQNITNEATARSSADTTLQGNIDALNTAKIDKTSITDNLNSDSATEVLSAKQGKALDTKLNEKVHIDAAGNEFSYVGDVVTKTSYFKNLKTGTQTQKQESMHIADDTDAGFMSPSDVRAIADLKARVEGLEGTTVRLLYTASQNPTSQDIANFVTSKGYTQDLESIAVVVAVTYHIWHYYTGEGWRDDGADTVKDFTNTIPGVIKGKNEDGFIYAENDGTGSVKGWSDLKARVTNLETDISDEATARGAADTTLQGNIDAEVTARGNADTTLQGNIDAEATARSSADSTLQGNIDAEATARSQADTALDGKITAEASRASTAEGTLQGNISAEATARQTADTALQNNIDALNTAKVDKSSIGYIELSIPSGNFGVLTDAQYNEVIKDIAIIKLGDIVYYKTFKDDESLIFTTRVETSVINNTYTKVSQGIINISISLKTYRCIEKDIVSTYTNSQIDTKLSGKQPIINSTHKLSADLIEENTNKKFVTEAEKGQITTNATAISTIKDGTTLDSFADVETELAKKQPTLSNTNKLNPAYINNMTTQEWEFTLKDGTTVTVNVYVKS